MKKFIQSTLSAILLISLSLSLAACGGKNAESSEKQTATKGATYLEDTELGTGKTVFTLLVKMESGEVKFTIHTDKKTVGDALLENKLIKGENGPYGLDLKTVNGITADYDVDKTYWAFYVDGEYASVGVDSEKIKNGAEYQLVYTK